MSDRVLSTSLRFVSNVTFIVTYLVVSRYTHPTGIDYSVKLQLAINKTGKKLASEQRVKRINHWNMLMLETIPVHTQGISKPLLVEQRKSHSRKRLAHHEQKQQRGMFCKKRYFRNFAKFTGKHQRQSFFFNKVAGWGKISKFCEFCKILGTPYLQNTSGRLLLFQLQMQQSNYRSVMGKPGGKYRKCLR